MRQKILSAVILFSIVGFTQAQSISNSPYAAYGLGDIKYDNTLDINTMGGISSAYVEDFGGNFNFKNPAANGNFSLTSVKIEGKGEFNYFDTGSRTVNKNSSYLSNISIAFPINKKWKAGMGYQPYSTRSYTVKKLVELPVSQFKQNYFEGKGTLNTVQAAVSYQATPELGLGFRTNFLFGNLYSREELSLSNAELINGYEDKNKYKTFNFTLGAVYQKVLADDHKWTVGGQYTFGNVGSSEGQYTNSTYFYNGENIINQNIINRESKDNPSAIPSSIGLGAGYGMDRRWFASLQGDLTMGQDFSYFGKKYSLDNTMRVAAGGWWIPNNNNFRNYFQRVLYRGGIFYEKGGLALDKLGNINTAGTQSINTMGLTFGASLPFQSNSSNRLSNFDIGVEAGRRGTTSNGLIAQNYILLKIGLNFTDKWFQKRFYD